MALAFLLAWMTFGNAIEPWQLLLVTAAGGIVQAIDLPARLAFVMDMTSREDLGNAVALNAMLFNGARIIGPALTGMVLLWMKPWSCFLANGLSYIAVLGALACMTVPTTTGSSHHKRGARYMLDGFVYLARQRDLLFLVLLMTATSLFAWPFLPLLPALARHELGASDADYGFIYGLTLSGTGVGAVIAAWAVATFGSLPNGRRFIGTGVALVSIGLVCLSAAPNIPLAICFSGMIGCGLIMFLSKSQSVVQLSASDHNRGRIMGIWAMTQSGAIPLGGLLFGHAADRWGVSAVLRFQGLACAGTAALLALAFSAWKLWNVKAADPARAEQPS